ncbi:hypothetical protein [Arthrobacter sp. A2-55]|uniref:hypothetical protein n=1 Tax=Arthrobacter sp. A2-55 TaxID=2897337 RepID=UPI0021CD8242|nr:hypothetical protein [Arthrobacter sp. A2-55]MCU6479022.1 hypothetical protein [Arthrobacter sp. A2-55]
MTFESGPNAPLPPDPVGPVLFALSEDAEHISPSGNPGKVLTVVRQLAPGELENLQQAIQTVTNVIQGFIVYMTQALDDLAESLQRIYAEASGMSRDPNSRRIELEYRMLNVCAAIKMFEEHIYSEIDRKYGVDSTQRTEARQIFNKTYDESGAYRILYYLRNAITHGSRSLLTFIFNATTGPNGSPNYDVRVNLLRDKFAASNAKAAIRQEIQELPEDPNTLAMCFEVLPVMTALNQQLMPLLEPALMDRIITLAHLINETSRAGGYPVLGVPPLLPAPSERGSTVDVPLSVVPLPEPVRDFVATVVNANNANHQ